ncbi:F-box protein At2g05970-like [Cornus florida]|uniref:F-box protein At2g05970-like n=1 Tax=Cornus florida TaxID=4283 RepID=UPI00289F4B2E|nr:F-box protein At2g05970-like [Cornus florida]
MANKTHLGHPTKRRKTSSESSPDWSRLPSDLWESILNQLTVVDSLRAGAVFHSWCSLAKALISSPSSPLFDQPPLLLLPTQDGDQGNKNSRCLYNFAEKKVYKQLKNIPEHMAASHIGSSRGWLIFLDRKKAAPFMFSPFLEVQIQLPCVACRTFIYGLFVHPIEKAILTSHPIHSEKYWVVVICGSSSKLAYSKCGHSEWTALNGTHQPYCDIISYKDHVFALAETLSVEIWDFNTCLNIPTKKMDFRPSFPRKKFELDKSLLGNSRRCYMVESKGDILLIMRYIGKRLTKVFHVYKLDFDQRRWVKLESLGDRLLFLGRNHSVSLSQESFPFWKRNSIYFTDDYRDRKYEPHMYRGHDTGRFDLEDRSIELINKDYLQKIDPAPIWIVPNP